MGKVDEYRRALQERHELEPFLLEHSGLPGPRANLELVAAVVEEADAANLRRWAALGTQEAPSGTSREFLPVCGVAGLGRLAAEGDRAALSELRRHTADPRWRVREAVAIALQRYGDDDLAALVGELRVWAAGSAFERRAVVAALCEPRLLRDPDRSCDVLTLLDRITAELDELGDRRSDGFKALRKALGYGWSVAVVALPDVGKPLFEALLGAADPDVRWIARENLRKKRLERLDAVWVEACLARLGQPARAFRKPA